MDTCISCCYFKICVIVYCVNFVFIFSILTRFGLKKKFPSNNFLVYSINEMAADVDTSSWYITFIYFSVLSCKYAIL